MPRGRLVTPKDDLDAIRLFTENHIVQFRRGTSGRITEVDHVQFGWMKPERYYMLQKLHDIQPLIAKFIEGGYRLKQALWNIDIKLSIFGSGTEIPLALAFIGGATALAGVHTARGRPDLALFDMASLFLPFGELYFFLMGAVTIAELSGDVADIVKEAVKDVDLPLSMLRGAARAAQSEKLTPEEVAALSAERERIQRERAQVP